MSLFRSTTVLGVLVLTAQSLAAHQAWRRVAPQDAGFAVLMPADPKIATAVHPSPDGLLQTRTLSVAEDTAHSYLVSWTGYRPGVLGKRPSAALFDKSRDALLEAKSGRLVREADETRNGHPARTIEFEEFQGRITSVLFAVTDTCFYEVMATTGASDGPARERFLASFQVDR